MPLEKILFLNLKAFSLTGGIEKFNRAFLKALADTTEEGKFTAYSWSMYDEKPDTKYFGENNYKGFKGKRLLFVLKVVLNAHRYNAIILSHINLSIAAWLVKRIYPSKKIILIAHGIEIWDELKGLKKKVLQQADLILAVSAFTKQKIVDTHHIDPDKITIFHNTLDPFFSYPSLFNKPQYLLDRYGLQVSDRVVLTLTRLASTEKNKGYDLVIRVMTSLKKSFPNVKYFLAGKPDDEEKKRISNVIDVNRAAGSVVLTGFIKEEEITDHYLLADVFVLPSQKEGFGIVFIEAMACGLPVIAGNKDGSVDALKQGQLGTLIDPESETEILHALESILQKKDIQQDIEAKKKLQQKVIKEFGFASYKKRLLEVLE